MIRDGSRNFVYGITSIGIWVLSSSRVWSCMGSGEQPQTCKRSNFVMFFILQRHKLGPRIISASSGPRLRDSLDPLYCQWRRCTNICEYAYRTTRNEAATRLLFLISSDIFHFSCCTSTVWRFRRLSVHSLFLNLSTSVTYAFPEFGERTPMS